MHEKLFRDYYFGRPKKFSKLSKEEIFQHFQLEYLEEFILMDAKDFQETKARLLQLIENWKLEFSLRGITYYSPIHKIERKFLFAKIDIFSYQDEDGIWKTLVKDHNIGKSYLEQFDSKVDVLKFMNKFSLKDWKLRHEEKAS